MPAAFQLFPLGKDHGQHALVETRLDLIGIDRIGQPQGSLEAAEGPLDDMEVLLGACGALVQVIAHPVASRHASGPDLQWLRNEHFRHVVSVVLDDLIEASRRRKTRSCWIFAPWSVVVYVSERPLTNIAGRDR